VLEEFRDLEFGSNLILADDAAALPDISGREFFKIFWNRDGVFHLDLDGSSLQLEKNQLTCLTPDQVPDYCSTEGDSYLLLFNREFYCIHENDHEVSCEGLLFWGSSELPVLSLEENEVSKFETLFNVFKDELNTKDKIQGEMLRMLLKRLIIKSTRLARNQQFPSGLKPSYKELIRQYHILVEQNYKIEHKVLEYADRLHKSPKTLSNVFAKAGHKTPLEVIHARIAMEGKRLLSKTGKTAKEISYELGFHDQSHFSRFFKKETGMSPSKYRDRDAKTVH
jgi:AraC-like DNA-binding protein